MKKINILFIIMIFSVNMIFISFMNFKNDQISIIDNRKLTELNSLEQNFSKNLEAFVSDRIGFRTELMYSYTYLNNILFGKLEHPSYMYGKDGHIYPKVLDDTVDTNYINGFSSFLLKFQNYCSDRNIKFLYWLNPSKASVYDEYLPDGVNLPHKTINYLLEQVEKNNINFYNSTERLRAEKANTILYNKEYDVNHWNDNGALIGIQGMLEALKIPVYIPTIDDYVITMTSQDTLPQSILKIDDKIPEYDLKQSDYEGNEELKDELNLNSKHNFFVRTINKKSNGPKVLLFRGSYLNSKEKFISQSFSEVTYIHSYHNVIDYSYYIDLFKPDIVIFESADYVLNDTYFPLDLMNNVVNKPSILNYSNLVQDNFANVDEKTLSINKNDSLTKINGQIMGDKVSSVYVTTNGKTLDCNVHYGETITFNVDVLTEDIQNPITITLIDRYAEKRYDQQITIQ